MVTDSGLWIKDEVKNRTLIIKSNQIKGYILSKTLINEFNQDFELIRTIESEKINIQKNEWIIFNPIITKDNISQKKSEIIILKTNFNHDKINKLFSNISQCFLIISTLLTLSKFLAKFIELPPIFAFASVIIIFFLSEYFFIISDII